MVDSRWAEDVATGLTGRNSCPGLAVFSVGRDCHLTLLTYSLFLNVLYQSTLTLGSRKLRIFIFLLASFPLCGVISILSFHSCEKWFLNVEKDNVDLNS